MLALTGAVLIAISACEIRVGRDPLVSNLSRDQAQACRQAVRNALAERGVSEDEIVAEITARMPLGEIPADEDVAEAVVFFCSDRARMITGQSLLVNCGELMP